MTGNLTSSVANDLTTSNHVTKVTHTLKFCATRDVVIGRNVCGDDVIVFRALLTRLMGRTVSFDAGPGNLRHSTASEFAMTAENPGLRTDKSTTQLCIG